MNINQIAQDLFAHFPPEERSIPDSATYPGRNSAVLNTINGTLEEMYGLSSPWVARDDRGITLKAPVTLDLTVTSDSVDAVIQEADWKDWMAGCSIIIAGQQNDNRIRNAERNIKLRIPYDGESGTVSATVYHDSVTLDTDVMDVIEPVKIDGIPIPAVASTSSMIQTSSDRDFGFHKRTASYLVKSVADSASAPRAYAIESWRPTPNTAPVSRIMLTPAPSEKCYLEYSCKLTPPVVTSLSSTDELPVPHKFVASIFMPIAEKRISASPFYRGVRSAESIAENYSMALEQLAKSNPRKTRGLKLYTRY